MEAARSLLKDKNLPNCFWVEVIAVVVYVLNIFPTQAVKGRTPHEAWNGRKPNVSHFKKICLIAFALVPSQKRRKLDEKSIKCILVGYSEETKGYRLCDPN